MLRSKPNPCVRSVQPMCTDAGRDAELWLKKKRASGRALSSGVVGLRWRLLLGLIQRRFRTIPSPAYLLSISKTPNPTGKLLQRGGQDGQGGHLKSHSHIAQCGGGLEAASGFGFARGLGFRVLGFRVLRFWVRCSEDLGFIVYGFCGVSGLGFRALVKFCSSGCITSEICVQLRLIKASGCWPQA